MKINIKLKQIICKKLKNEKYLFINKQKEYIYFKIPLKIKMKLNSNTMLELSLKEPNILLKKNINLLKIVQKKILQNNYGLLYYFDTKVLLKGVGFKFLNFCKKKITMSLGYSHLILIKIPKLIKIFYKNENTIILISVDNQKLNEFCFFLQKFKSPIKYKIKGIYILNKKNEIK